MRMARKNQRPLWYSLHKDSDDSYERDSDGNIIYDIVDGEQVPRENGGQTDEYTRPVKFFGTIQNAGGTAEAAAYGVSVGSYQARLLEVENGLPIKEMSLIYLHDPSEDDTAEYRVVSKPLALNQIVYLLKRNE